MEPCVKNEDSFSFVEDLAFLSFSAEDNMDPSFLAVSTFSSSFMKKRLKSSGRLWNLKRDRLAAWEVP